MVLKSNNSFSVGKKNNLAPAKVNGQGGLASKTKSESNKLKLLQVIKGVFPGEAYGAFWGSKLSDTFYMAN